MSGRMLALLGNKQLIAHKAESNQHVHEHHSIELGLLAPCRVSDTVILLKNTRPRFCDALLKHREMFFDKEHPSH
jgi:hypothetical protein